jgi:hypothetical protein
MSRLRTHAAATASALGLAALAGCATPAVNVKVPTATMDQAYRASVSGLGGAPALPATPPAATRIVETTIRPDRPSPIVAAPDIRLAFFYQWIDGDGNMHYPSWVAIPVESFRWVVPDLGGTAPLDGSRSQSEPANPLPKTKNGSSSGR